MHPFSFLGVILSLALASVAQIGLTAQYFQVHGSNQGNVKLTWKADPSTQNFTVVRKESSGTSSKIAQVTSNIYDNYGPPEGLLTYQVLVNGGSSQSSNEVTISSQNPLGSTSFSTFDNTQPSTLKLISQIKLGGTYYNYVIQSDSNAMSQIVEQTSADGYTFSGERVLLTRKEVCAGSSDGFCKLEAVTFVQNPRTSEVLMWAHWENKQDYGQARVAVAFGQPGGKWTFGDMNIYKLTNDWHNQPVGIHRQASISHQKAYQDHGVKWSAQWLDPEPPNRQIILPISLSNGYADYHFYPQLRYRDGQDEAGAYGIQSGQVISIGQKFSTPGSASDAGGMKAINGINLDPGNVYQSPTVPFSYVVDFGAPSVLTQFDLTTKLVGGSETAYQFTISARVNDRSPFKVIVDKSSNTRVGFVSSILNDPTAYSAVMLQVQKVTNVHNKNAANWAEGINQFTVYGQGGATRGRTATRRTNRLQRKI
ncbi:hypothetical protein PCANC_04956 [Puccinia coronata f. sp. avenae]|uniref:Uncharacterized protein n=1 Tax=Puccinia coronata f. sp. avenae TaxID=200324 RepID=A0A2N5VWK1_9BASI|nr:hypothetical protein PCANC_04956 [Puccinia coronata f. sp. avenae]